ncbi:MAG: hypothetical protein NXI14_03335 [bacterium]|nr:hypothetical protein [bacterium]
MTNQTGSTGSSERVAGNCRFMFAFDAGFQIDLDEARKLTADATPYQIVRGRRPSPGWFGYQPAPLRLLVNIGSVAIGDYATDATVEMIVYDFGAILVTFSIPFECPVDRLTDLGLALYDNDDLQSHARTGVSAVFESIHSSIERPNLRDIVEDYCVFAIRERDGEEPPTAFLDRHAQSLGRAIEAEAGELGEDQLARTLGGRMSYGVDDLAVIDWNAAILLDPEPDDLIAVLQHANVELLQLRILDEELDSILDHSDELLARFVNRRWYPLFKDEALVSRFAMVQTDAAVLFEGVNNAIKLMGNQYLARVYRLASERLSLPAWQSNVQRKLDAADGVYQRITDTAATRRLETLEVVIIVLIAISIVLPFVVKY